MRVIPLLLAPGYRNDRRQVETTINAVEGACDHAGVSDVTDDERRGGREIGGITGRQVVENPNPMSIAEESVCEVRSDKAASARDQKKCHPLRSTRVKPVPGLPPFLDGQVIPGE